MYIGILLLGLAIGALIAYGIFKPYESKGIDVSKLPEKPVDFLREQNAYAQRIAKERTICEVKEEYEIAAEIHKTQQLKDILHAINRAALDGEDSVNIHYEYAHIHQVNIKILTDKGYSITPAVYRQWRGGDEYVELPSTKISGWATADCSQSNTTNHEKTI